MPWDKNDNIKDAATWLSRKVELIEEKNNLIQRRTQLNLNSYAQVYRGGVFDCELGLGNIGGEKNKLRPVVVLQRNNLNRGHTVVVVPLSTKFPQSTNGLPRHKNHVLLRKADYPFLDKDSVAKFEDIRSVDIVRLRNLRGNVSQVDMKRMKNALLFLSGY